MAYADAFFGYRSHAPHAADQPRSRSGRRRRRLGRHASPPRDVAGTQTVMPEKRCSRCRTLVHENPRNPETKALVKRCSDLSLSWYKSDVDIVAQMLARLRAQDMTVNPTVRVALDPIEL